ncbi:MAG: Ig-like domain-containing protein [Ignavibacteria bacterium]|nr:Ig-like domain-containing protein [Ignavibacteria bacterium]
MVKDSKKIIILILTLISMMLVGCANQLPPGGGEIDLIPPEIIYVLPESGTTNYKEAFIEFEFSEYVDKRSFKEAVFISPSIDGDLEINWSGTGCRIYFPSKLKENITYTITIGTDVVDFNNKNRMAESFNLVFSTGEKIDYRRIEGNVYFEKPNGIMLFAYKIEDHDTINPSKVKPDYVSQSGDLGQYSIAGLAKGSYRVFAVKDEYKDFLFQAEQDLVGVPTQDVYLSEEDSLFSGLNFYLSKIDTIKPRILSALMTDRNHILLGFSEEIDLTKLSKENFKFVDSTENLEYKLRHIYKGRTKVNEAVVTLSDSLPIENRIYLIVNNFHDLIGNISKYDYTEVTVYDKLDTTSVMLVSTTPDRGNDQVDFIDTKILFSFDDAFDIDPVRKGITFSDTSKQNLQFDVERIDDASFYFIPKNQLKPQTFYNININFNYFKDVAGNSIDSIYLYNFKTFNGQNFTGLSGSVIYVELDKNPILVLEDIKDKNNTYRLNLTKSKFEFARVKPGEYKISCFYDENKDGKYSYGFPYEFIPAEKFFISTADLNLPPRWSVSDFEFVIIR